MKVFATNDMARRIATYVYCTAALNTFGGSWCISFNEIESALLLKQGTLEDKSLQNDVVEILLKQYGYAVSDVDVITTEEEGHFFDVLLFTNYTVFASPDEDEDEDDAGWKMLVDDGHDAEKQMETYEVTEWCPYCENEVALDIPVDDHDLVAKCPSCGTWIVACSACTTGCTGPCTHETEANVLNKHSHKMR